MLARRALRLRWGLCLLVGWGGLTAAWSAVVKLTDGSEFRRVTVRRLDSGRFELQLPPYGTIVLASQQIHSIDGVLLQPPLAESQDWSPLGALPAPRAPGAAERAWHMEIFLAAAAVVTALWLSLLIWVQRDAAETVAEVKQANALVLLLPVVGFLIYLRQRRLAGGGNEEFSEVEPPEPAGGKPRRSRRSLFRRPGGKGAGPQTARQRLALEFFDGDGQPIETKRNLPGMSGVESAREVLAEAILSRASDIHLEPREKGWRVRFRIDGVLQERQLFDRVDNQRLLAALKTLAQIDVAEKRKAQDGRFRVRTARGEVDFRAATSRSIHGEKLVLRLLERKTGLITLPELGMAAAMLATFERAIHSRNGMILATGPTGSGKTSTLYAALSQLDVKRLNVMTIEDPVEYEIEGATQIPVNIKAGVTYESGLRSILRQDPDVIFVGEMRDAEAAAIAVRAALTGHLMFSSLHAKDVVSAVARLQDLGVEKYQLTSALLMVVAQRLVRVLCPHCREPIQAKADELQEIGLTLPAGRQIYRERGCELCDQTGFQGRTGIFELLVMDDAARKAINDGATEAQLWEIARRAGTRPFREDGVDKILQGITTVEEVRSAG